MISKRMQEMVKGGSVIRAMFEEGKNMALKYGKENVYDFSLGNPNLPAPDEVNKAIERAVKECDSTFVHGYMSNAGYDDVRELIAKNLNQKYNADYDKTSIIMTVGAAGGLNVILKALLDEGDEVVVIAPFFSEYANYVKNYNGKLVIVPHNPPTFEPDINAFESCLSEKTKAVIINTPNNPTGIIYDESILSGLSQAMSRAEQKFGTSIYLISDEPYRELVYDLAKQPFVANFYKNTICGYSYSKSLSLAGERIGYLAINKNCDDYDDLVSACTVATRILGFVNAPSLIQRALTDCMNARVDVNFYDNNRKLLIEIMQECGFEYVYPSGAFYLFVKAPDGDDFEFCKIAKKHRLLLVPASGFGSKGWVRIAYCVSPETIINSKESFLKLAKESKKI